MGPKQYGYFFTKLWDHNTFQQVPTMFCLSCKRPFNLPSLATILGDYNVYCKGVCIFLDLRENVSFLRLLLCYCVYITAVDCL